MPCTLKCHVNCVYHDSLNEGWDDGVEEVKMGLKHGGICPQWHHCMSYGMAHCVPQVVHLQLMHSH